MSQGLESKAMVGKLGLGLVGIIGATYAVTSYLMRPAQINIQNIPGLGATDQKAVVQVSGSVKKPGVYTLTTDTRVKDAIGAAGGTVTGADLSKINQAARLVDGTVLYIPSVADPDASSCSPDYVIGAPSHAAPLMSPSVGKSKSSRSSGKKSLPAPGSISLNSATAEELDQLPGVGPSTAQKILEYRQQHGRFKSIDELLAVKGIGPKKLEAMRQFLKL